MTYDAYLAELAARQANLGPPTEIRRPNEGNRDDKWANAKPLAKDEGQSAYILGETKDKTRNRERKTKQLVEIETRYGEPRENRRGGGDRGGRGRGERGGRGGRGGDRGDRDRAPRGERYGGDRHGERGNRGGKDSSNVNINDARSFPALGAA
jgi:plasminogen activator inhibitor 1 RNA-binding protein